MVNVGEYTVRPMDPMGMDNWGLQPEINMFLNSFLLCFRKWGTIWIYPLPNSGKMKVYGN